MSGHRWTIGLSLFVAVVAGVAGCSDDGGSSTPARRIAFASDSSGNADIYLMRIDGSGVTNLTKSPSNDDQPAWSPDGSSIAFVSDRTGTPQIFIMDTLGGHQTQLTFDNFGAERPTWSGDGKHIAYTAGGGLLRTMAPDGSDTLSIGAGKEPAWNPHVNRIAIAFGTSCIDLADPDGSHQTTATRCPSGTVSGMPSWNPGGDELVFYRENQAKYALIVSDTSATVEFNLTAGLDSTEARGMSQPAWSPDGSEIAFTCNTSSDQNVAQYDLCLIHPDGSGFRRLTTGSSAENWPAWAP